jgi:hypothetical protein
MKMKKLLLLVLTTVYCLACQNTSTKSDAWELFLKCTDNNCIKETVAVKDAFLKNPKAILTQFQATYESGDDRVVGWLYLFRDSVLINPKMGTIEERMKLQQSVIEAAKPFENDPKIQEMAKNVMDYLSVSTVDIKAGKINDSAESEYDVVTTPHCYQFSKNGEHVALRLDVGENGQFSGYYNWYIDGKDGTQGVLSSKSNFNKDTLFIKYTYIQEGMVANEPLIFVKKGNNLVNLVSEIFDEEGRMVLSHKEKLKIGNTLNPVACNKIDKEIQSIVAMEKDLVFSHPEPAYSEKDLKVIAKIQGAWQSLDDPKASIKIENGKYTDSYEGQEPMPQIRCIYYPICPKDCNPVAKMSCLKLIAQDEVCYSIIKADGKVLHISQIGGTGNTNRYVKKK